MARSARLAIGVDEVVGRRSQTAVQGRFWLQGFDPMGFAKYYVAFFGRLASCSTVNRSNYQTGNYPRHRNIVPYQHIISHTRRDFVIYYVIISLCQMAVFSGIAHFSRLAAGLFSYFLLRGPQGGGVDLTVQALAPAGLRGTCSRWSKSRDPSSNSGDGVSLPKNHPAA